ncbi:hypothetical protein AB0F88_39940 [Streptosporangium sp. NPDC023963]|uniref:hypothetical protein n=1 Tax=Streptosporangium sp. NPDC023963 TaxID=3155608 RepID=UPI0034426BA3
MNATVAETPTPPLGTCPASWFRVGLAGTWDLSCSLDADHNGPHRDVNASSEWSD